jgi:hypothetical protein
MKVINSTDWHAVRDQLTSKIIKFPLWSNQYKDLSRLILNIDHVVRELSRTEVEARRNRSNNSEELISRINQDIELVEEYLLLAILLG